jgi:hypothetical protein
MLFKSRLPAKLYKYLSAKSAKSFFENPEIRFTFSNRLNDPFDLAPVGAAYATDHYGAIGVFCLSSTPVSMPMWAHYGDAGHGVVLEFRTDAPFFEEHFPSQVKYRTSRPTVEDTMAALRVKSKEWAYEQEWRCFMTLPKNPRYFNQAAQAVCLPFPADALTAIIYGHDSTVSKEGRDFLSRIGGEGVQELICRVDPWEFKLNLRPPVGTNRHDIACNGHYCYLFTGMVIANA